MIIRQSQISVIISVILHILALFVLAAVKMYKAESINDNMSVTFVDVQETKPLRRSALVRPIVSLSKSPRNKVPESYITSPANRASVEFYVSVPEQVFSEVKSVKQEVFRDIGMQKPSIRHGDELSKPVTTDLLNEPDLRRIQTQPRVSAGHELLGDLPPAQAKPKMSATEDALPKFLAAVRKRIESRKRYPMAAQNAGIEGRSSIRMIILKNGRLEKAEIVESSGHAILDRSALQSVHDAAPFPPIPDAVKMEKIEMNIRLVFKI